MSMSSLDQIDNEKTAKEVYKHYFKFEPIPTVDWLNTRLSLSYEFTLKETVDFEFGGGFAYHLWGMGNFDKSDASGFGGLQIFS